MPTGSRRYSSSQELGQQAVGESSFIAFFQRQFSRPVALPKDICLEGKTAIITGSNSGLGFEAARQLLRAQLSRLILAVRSQERGDAAAVNLRREFPSAEVVVWLLDMESYDSVQAFAAKCAEEVLQRSIDIVILNAGVQRTQYEIVAETKHEKVLQVNFLSTMLLAILLLPVLKDGGYRQRQRRTDSLLEPDDSPPPNSTPVLSIVTSDTAYTTDLNASEPSILKQLDRKPSADCSYRPFYQYARTKLLQQSFVPKLAEYIDPDDVVLNLVNPGFCRDTAFNDGVMEGLALRLYQVFMAAVSRTVEVGASTYVDAVAVKGPESHGSMVSDWQIKPFPPVLYGETGRSIQEKLWEETMNEFDFAGAREIVTRRLWPVLGGE